MRPFKQSIHPITIEVKRKRGVGASISIYGSEKRATSTAYRIGLWATAERSYYAFDEIERISNAGIF